MWPKQGLACKWGGGYSADWPVNPRHRRQFGTYSYPVRSVGRKDCQGNWECGSECIPGSVSSLLATNAYPANPQSTSGLVRLRAFCATELAGCAYFPPLYDGSARKAEWRIFVAGSMAASGPCAKGGIRLVGRLTGGHHAVSNPLRSVGQRNASLQQSRTGYLNESVGRELPEHPPPAPARNSGRFLNLMSRKARLAGTGAQLRVSNDSRFTSSAAGNGGNAPIVSGLLALVSSGVHESKPVRAGLRRNGLSLLTIEKYGAFPPLVGCTTKAEFSAAVNESNPADMRPATGARPLSPASTTGRDIGDPVQLGPMAMQPRCGCHRCIRFQLRSSVPLGR